MREDEGDEGNKVDEGDERSGFCSGVWPAKRSGSAEASAAPPQPFLHFFSATRPE